MAEDARPQLVAVSIDQLAGQENEPLGRVAIEPGKPLGEERGDLGGKRCRTPTRRPRLVQVGDAGLGGVGDHEAQVRLRGSGEEGVPIPVRIDAAADGA